ncbi:sensor histidine kinase [Calidifontibacillus erzurumensis]|uniref:histidine kinase n=2 Tax=Calidifontibacillus erzurumensis TaxID=2741433 RepID=A0A8J8GF79_9BACI|nr:sensor histidine kinase [Calidifontibacillus erzurumensis]NSL52212.1 sensor histidine kinase [Calidifontibacillus erzurumensis]
MKFFLHDHMLFVILYFFNMIFLFIFYRKLGGFETLENVYYFIFLSSFLLGVFLLFRYFSYKKLYDKLSKLPSKLEDTLSSAGTAPIAVGINKLLQTQYNLYQEQIQRYKCKQAEHLTFMNQWVHQMKTPISVIHLILQENEGEPYVENIRQEIERISRGLNIAMNMARLDRFEHDFSVETIFLYSIVTEAINDQKRYFIRKRVYPEVKIDVNITVKSDRKWLKFIVHQLLVNAIKYTVGENKKITVSAYMTENGKVLEVKDQGVGIPQKDIRRVFDPFFTGENGRKFGESTGMGLYLVNEVCKKLGHKIEIESKVEEGTSIKIIFHQCIITNV